MVYALGFVNLISVLKKNVMKFMLVLLAVFLGFTSYAQSLSKMPDSVRAKLNAENNVGVTSQPKPVVETDDIIKDRLVKLALKNPELQAADARIAMAEIDKRKAKSTLLSSVSLGANINEFVISNSAAASFFPKYNLGVSIPLDIFAKSKAAKQNANQQLIISEAEKLQQERAIKMETLTRYENYKEAKDLVELQKVAMEDDFAAYQRGQQDYANDDITLSDMTKLYKIYITEKASLTSLQKNLNVAIIELESIIGVKIETALGK